MNLKLRNKYKSVRLAIFSGTITRIEYPYCLDFDGHEPIQYAGFNSPNNIVFHLQAKDDTLKEFQFHNSCFDFREGHSISVITSVKTSLHRLVINHNTQRYWLTNTESLSSELLWEKYVLAFTLLFFYLAFFVSAYFIIIPFFDKTNVALMVLTGVAVLTATFILPKIYRLIKISRNQFLFEKRFRPQLQTIARNLLNDEQ
ncbi:hypothetical protein MATR_03950 [Marivirga tractuosa]|uniref:Uncharacterized protein n=1 Tax=Marivirga tractuosa (strain ATCC 23168 / DSM 4126 / NBRC 15989 / NCIMB 1408 / VKM B-1430 / H-43) TaxID=643867 RepID=E4TTR5_MARTH|nr:hypothetical protein [Marivirga tractuosa]ADR21970.1 hypothetical protein Ftrac_1985 [Marivirga tractuosa DSM 4126]BDD13570.1 hypothetical protein MATR_03950 [Marivirga tractuosa]